MSNNKLNILITRPAAAGRELQQHLQGEGFSSYCQPCFDYQSKDTLTQLTALHQQLVAPVVIFVSVAAVEFANQLISINTWPQQEVIAVGSATQRALKTIGVNAIRPEKHDSEGLLSLIQLSNVNKKHILIVRGNGGRELIAQELTQRGAFVHYFESYQRVWRKLSTDVIKKWQVKQINCILVTSNALLEFIVNLINNSDTYWKESCIWLVASKRIALNAEKLGLKCVINVNGAGKHAITTALHSLVLYP